MEDRMRICFVTFTFSPLVGGSEARAEKQARQLQAFGHDVTIVTFRHYRQWKRNEMLDGLPVVRVGGIYRRNGRLLRSSANSRVNQSFSVSRARDQARRNVHNLSGEQC